VTFNVFYSTFTNVFFIFLSRFFTFLTFFVLVQVSEQFLNGTSAQYRLCCAKDCFSTIFISPEMAVNVFALYATGCVTFCGWTTDGYHNRHYTGRFQVSREDQVDQELTG